jgi:hypothetical protein
MNQHNEAIDIVLARRGLLADELGQLAADIKAMKNRKAEIEATLKAANVKTVEGRLFRVTISYDVATTRTDWKTIAAKLNPSRQLITAHSKTTTADRVNVRALSTTGR